MDSELAPAWLAEVVDVRLTAATKDRFVKCFRPAPSGCWKWKAGGKRGYGYFEGLVASRVAYTLFNGPIPDGLIVCHRCDDGYCVNPAHLFLGTHHDNAMDSYRKGRRNGPPKQRANAHSMVPFKYRLIYDEVRPGS